MDKKDGRGRLRRLADRALARFSPPVLGLFIVLGCGGLFLAVWSLSKHGAGAPELIGVEVRKGDIEDLVTATGALQPRDYVDVGAQVSGQVKKIYVEVGHVVAEGDLLAEIDAEQSAARVEASLAQMRSLEAQLEQRRLSLVKAERDLARYRNLVADDAATLESLQNAETDTASMRAQMVQLRAQIDQLRATTRVEEANLKYTRIYAPMSGTVVSIAAKKGQTLNTNQQAPTLMRIADLSVMTVQTQVSEADVSKLRVGMETYFTTLGGRGRRWYGKLTKVEPTPTVTNNVVLYNALFEVPNDSRILMTQMTAQVFFVVAQVHNALVIPMSALNQFPGQRRLNGMGQDARSTRREASSETAGSGDAPRPGAEGEGRARRAQGSDAEPTRRQADGEARGPRREATGNSDAPRPDGEGRARRTQGSDAEPVRRQADDEARGPRREAAGNSDAPRPDGEGRARRAQGSDAEPVRRQADGEARGPRRETAGNNDAPRPDSEGRTRRAQGSDGGNMRRQAEEEARDPDRRDAVARPENARSGEGEHDNRRTEQRAAGERAAVAASSAEGQQRPRRMAAPAGAQAVVRQREARVKVMLPDGDIEERKITVGISNRIHAEVISGLEAGEKVVAGVREPEKARSEAQSNRQQQSAVQQQMPSGPGMPGGMGRGR